MLDFHIFLMPQSHTCDFCGIRETDMLACIEVRDYFRDAGMYICEDCLQNYQ